MSRVRRIGSISSELLKKSKEAALTAVQIFNNPNITFKSESFIVLMNIAWTILLLLAYLHDEKFIGHSKITKKYKALARSLKDDIDEYWIFVYEVLTFGNLKNEWRQMKQANITFIRSEFLS